MQRSVDAATASQKGSASWWHAAANVSNRYTTARQALPLERGMKLVGRRKVPYPNAMGI